MTSFVATDGFRNDGCGTGVIVVIVRPLWLMTTGLISTSPVTIIVPVFSLICTFASDASIGTGKRRMAEMKLSGRSRSVAGIVTTMFFGSSAVAIVSPVSPASLINFAIVLAVVQLAAGSSRISVNRPAVSMYRAGRSTSITAPPSTTPVVGVVGSSITTGPSASANGIGFSGLPSPSRGMYGWAVGPSIGVMNR